MPKLKFIRCVKSKINTIPVVDGQFIFTTDSYGIYLDLGSERKELSQIISLTSAERQEVLTPVTSFYFETDTGHLFYYDGKWTDISVDPNSLVITFNESEDLLEISSGETLSSAFGKIKTAINRLINHLKDVGNPHKVTKNQIGLSDVENKSSSTIRDELTKDNVINALGFTPPLPKKIYNKAVFIGDSTTQGWDNDNYSFVDIFRENNDFDEVVKLAQGGACLGPYQKNSAGAGKSCIEQIQNNLSDFIDADVVFIQYCLNDIAALVQDGSILGTPSDTSEKQTICGVARKIVETIYAQNPITKIYFLNLISDSNEFYKKLSSDITISEDDLPQYRYWHTYWNSVVLGVFREYDIPVINIMDDININSINQSSYTVSSGDGTHMNTNGNRNAYYKIKAALDGESERLYPYQYKDLVVSVPDSQKNPKVPTGTYERMKQANDLGIRCYFHIPEFNMLIWVVEFGEDIFSTQFTFSDDVPGILRFKLTKEDVLTITLTEINTEPSGRKTNLFHSVGEMKAANLQINDVVQTVSYHANKSLGGAKYIISEEGKEAGSVPLNNGLYANLYGNNAYTPSMFGASPDGGDSSVFIQNAVDKLECVIDANYTFETSINIPSRCHVHFNAGVEITYNGAEYAFAFINGRTRFNVDGFGSIICPNGTAFKMQGSSDNRINYATIKDIQLKALKWFDINNGAYLFFYNLKLYGYDNVLSEYGFKIDVDEDVSSLTNELIYIRDCQMSGGSNSSANLIVIERGSEIHITGCDLNNTNGSCIDIPNTSGLVYNVYIDGNNFYSRGYYVNLHNTQPLQNLSIQNNTFILNGEKGNTAICLNPTVAGAASIKVISNGFRRAKADKEVHSMTHTRYCSDITTLGNSYTNVLLPEAADTYSYRKDYDLFKQYAFTGSIEGDTTEYTVTLETESPYINAPYVGVNSVYGTVKDVKVTNVYKGTLSAKITFESKPPSIALRVFVMSLI